MPKSVNFLYTCEKCVWQSFKILEWLRTTLFENAKKQKAVLASTISKTYRQQCGIGSQLSLGAEVVWAHPYKDDHCKDQLGVREGSPLRRR